MGEAEYNIQHCKLVGCSRSKEKVIYAALINRFNNEDLPKLSESNMDCEILNYHLWKGTEGYYCYPVKLVKMININNIWLE